MKKTLFQADVSRLGRPMCWKFNCFSPGPAIRESKGILSKIDGACRDGGKRTAFKRRYSRTRMSSGKFHQHPPTASDLPVAPFGYSRSLWTFHRSWSPQMAQSFGILNATLLTTFYRKSAQIWGAMISYSLYFVRATTFCRIGITTYHIWCNLRVFCQIFIYFGQFCHQNAKRTFW